MRLDALRPNPANGAIYRESLRADGLESLAKSLRENGQREPITIDAANVILNGERRCRALRLIGAEAVDAIVDLTLRTPEEVEDYVLDCYSLTRRASLHERVNIFEALVRSYTRRHGRPRGRPKKTDMNVSDYWAPNRIRETAAREAGFSSRETARRARAVIRGASEDVKARLEAETLSIDAAYQLFTNEQPRTAGRQPDSDAIATARVDAEAPAVEHLSVVPRHDQPRTNADVADVPELEASQQGAIVGEEAEVPPATSEDSPVGNVPAARLEGPPARQVGNPSTSVTTASGLPENDVGFDVHAVELDDLLLAVYWKLRIVAEGSDPEVPFYIDRAVEVIRSAQRDAGLGASKLLRRGVE